MGITERRAREREEMRVRIMEAARCLFAKEGYEAVTLRRVADAIEYSPAAIYKYFQDKDDMVRALVEDDVAVLLDAFQPALAKCTPLERLRTLGLAYMDMAYDQPNHYRLMCMTRMPAGAKSEALEAGRGDPNTDAYALYVSVIADCISRGLFRDEFLDPELVAQTLWAGLHGIASLHITFCDKPGVAWRPVRDRVRVMQDLLIGGMVKPHIEGSAA